MFGYNNNYNRNLCRRVYVVVFAFNLSGTRSADLSLRRSIFPPTAIIPYPAAVGQLPITNNSIPIITDGRVRLNYYNRPNYDKGTGKTIVIYRLRDCRLAWDNTTETFYRSGLVKLIRKAFRCQTAKIWKVEENYTGRQRSRVKH